MRLRFILLPLACLAFAGAAGCTSNAEKLEAFCTDFHQAAEENQSDCDAMGAALDDVMAKHKGVKTFGNPDDEASQAALQSCEEGGRIIAMKCAGNAEVESALKTLESK